MLTPAEMNVLSVLPPEYSGWMLDYPTADHAAVIK